MTVRATAPDGAVKEFPAKVRIDSPVEMEYYRHGGILPAVLRKLARDVMPLGVTHALPHV